MEIDKDFIKNFENQIDALTSIEKAVQEAIKKARKKLEQLNNGESMEQVFGPNPRKQ